MCGIIGILGKEPVIEDLLNGLLSLQHRGQDAAGILTAKEGKFYIKKGQGLVSQVITEHDIPGLLGNIGLGHVRYPTHGNKNNLNNIQPLYVNHPHGISLVHNGNLINTKSLQAKLADSYRHINTDSDSELLLNFFAVQLQKYSSLITAEQCFAAVTSVMQNCHGAFASIALINNFGLVAFRDPCGIRPLVMGRQWQGDKFSYGFASESTAFQRIGYECLGELAAGEAVCINMNGEISRQMCTGKSKLSPCIFEYIYLAKPDSVLENISVYDFRYQSGISLGNLIKNNHADLNIDLVCPIPETSRVGAIGLAEQLQVPYREALVKNNYVGRTFIMPNQKLRKRAVRHKLSVITSLLAGKNVLLVDDSIVRGTTSREIIKLVRKAGAKAVYFAVLSPEVRFPNIYGIDMPLRSELAANQHSSVKFLIKADELIYLPLPTIVNILMSLNPKIDRVESSIFDGKYITSSSDLYATDYERGIS